MRLMPVLRVLSSGELTPDQLRWLLDELELDEVPRTDGPGAQASIAHRSRIDDGGNELVLDLSRLNSDGWVLALFYDRSGELPSDEIIDAHRRLLRGVVDHLSLKLIEVVPAATADEVFVMPEVEPAGGFYAPEELPTSWEFPFTELNQTWMSLGLDRDSPREVKAVKLRELTRHPGWPHAPEPLRSQVEEFLRES